MKVKIIKRKALMYNEGGVELHAHIDATTSCAITKEGLESEAMDVVAMHSQRLTNMMSDIIFYDTKRKFQDLVNNIRCQGACTTDFNFLVNEVYKTFDNNVYEIEDKTK